MRGKTREVHEWRKLKINAKKRHEAFTLPSPRRHGRTRRWMERQEGRKDGRTGGMRVKGGAISLGSSMTVKQSAQPLPEVCE